MKKKTLTVLGGGVAVVLSIVCGAPAWADTVDHDPGRQAIQDQYPATNDGSFSLSKAARGSSARSSVPGKGTLTGYQQKRLTPPGGSANDLTTGFSTKASYAESTTRVNLNGSSYALWHGSKPKVAKSIKLVDKMWADGVSISVSVPGGVGFSSSSTSATYSTTTKNSYQNRHSFTNVHFNGTAIVRVSQTSTSTTTFGTKSWVIVAG